MMNYDEGCRECRRTNWIKYDLFSFNLDYSHTDSCAMSPLAFLFAIITNV